MTHALTICKDWPRAPWQTYEIFARASTSHISDALGGVGVLTHRVHQISGRARLIGTVLPVWTASGDNLAPYAALRVLQAGDVMVLASAGHTECALVGDHIAGLLQNAEAAGLVTDGFVRDVDGLKKLSLPVYASGTSPRAPTKKGPGTIGLPISFEAVVLQAGDLIVGDRDGLVVVPRAELDQVANKLVALLERDQALELRLQAGATEPPAFEDLLQHSGIRWLT